MFRSLSGQTLLKAKMPIIILSLDTVVAGGSSVVNFDSKLEDTVNSKSVYGLSHRT
jgi:hypothetical protein